MFPLLRSTSVRLALVFAGLFVVGSLVLAGALWLETAEYLEGETDAVIAADTQAIGDRLRDLGLAGAAATIATRASETEDEHAIYLLADPSLAPLAGNLNAWPAEVGPQQGWYRVALVRGGHRYAARVLHVALVGGFQLLVGRDVQTRMDIRARIITALAWAALAALALAVAGGLVVRRSVLGRIAEVNRTTAAIVQGDLSKRLPPGHAGDEFGQLARTINDMLGQIEQLVDGVRHASNAVAHDLRTPLAELRSRLEDMARRMTSSTPSSEPLAIELQDAIADVDRLDAVFNALLRLASIDSGARRAGFREVELAPLVAQVAEVYAAVAEEKGARVVTGDVAEISVTGDPDLIAQALSNLLDNAIKYAPQGRIEVSLAWREDGHAALTVADNGPGIAEAERPKVVERFHRGDTSRGSPGSGLGLSEVEAVAKLHGGGLELTDNNPGLKATLVLNGNSFAGGLPAR